MSVGQEQGLVARLAEGVRHMVYRNHPANVGCAACERAFAAMEAATPEAVRKADAAPEMYAALLQVEAGLGDRLLAEGPLSPEYAHAVLRKLRVAKALAGGLP